MIERRRDLIDGYYILTNEQSIFLHNIVCSGFWMGHIRSDRWTCIKRVLKHGTYYKDEQDVLRHIRQNYTLTVCAGNINATVDLKKKIPVDRFTTILE